MTTVLYVQTYVTKYYNVLEPFQQYYYAWITFTVITNKSAHGFTAYVITITKQYRGTPVVSFDSVIFIFVL